MGQFQQACFKMLDVGLVQAVVLRHKEHGPIPKVLLAVMLVQSILDRITFADVDRRQATSFGRADQHVHAGLVELFLDHDLFVVRAIEDDADAGPVRLLDQSQTVGVAIWHEDRDREGTLLKFRHERQPPRLRPPSHAPCR